MIRKKTMNKKGISELVSYILLISLAIVLAAGFYVWIRYLVVPPEKPECPDEIGLVLANDVCFNPSNVAGVDKPGNITFVLRNSENFNIDGFTIHISNETLFSDIYILNNCTFSHERILNKAACGVEARAESSFFGEFAVNTIKKVSITPFQVIKGKEVVCKKTFDFTINNCR
jgi:hypothetical protein